MDDEFASDPFIQPDGAQARGDTRDSMFLHASMRLPPAEDAIPLRVRNLSAGGLMADCAILVEPGREVEVVLRNVGIVPGRIAWVREHRIGIAFLHRIDPRLARKPAAVHDGDARLVKRDRYTGRRPGLKIK